LKMVHRENTHVERGEDFAEVETDAPGAEEQLQVGSLGKYLAHCLGRLPFQVREAILLRFMQQLSYQEMAKLTGDRAATLQMRVTRAMSGLRICLEASGVSP
jgi:RNA polymerase sigma-70 factor, ECF subfamily